MLAARGHAIVVVSEFVQENVQELKASKRRRREMETMPLRKGLDGNAKAVKEIVVIFDVLHRLDGLREQALRCTEGDESGPVKAVGVWASGREEDGVEADRESLPVRK